MAKSTANEGLFGATGENGLTAANGPIASVVFEVEKNSAISADFLYYSGTAVSKPLFFASANGVDWTPITMQMTTNGNGRTYYRDCIGVDNRYVKIQINDVTEPVFWANDFRSFSYNLVDPSGDGKITADDIVVVQKQLLGVESGKNIDLNRDTLGNVKDLIRIKKILADKA